MVPGFMIKLLLRSWLFNHFKSLYSQDIISYSLSIPNSLPRLKAFNLLAHKNIENLEIKEALFNIGPWKATVINGFPIGFFQQY